jgi:hypothetical protein
LQCQPGNKLLGRPTISNASKNPYQDRESGGCEQKSLLKIFAIELFFAPTWNQFTSWTQKELE